MDYSLDLNKERHIMGTTVKNKNMNNNCEYDEDYLFWHRIDYIKGHCYEWFNNGCRPLPEAIKKDAPVLSNIELLSITFNIKDFEIGAILGRGSFGVVHEAQLGSKKVALKILTDLESSNQIEQLQRSFKAEKNLKGLRHRNIIKHLGSFVGDDLKHTKYVIYEYGGKYNLSQVLADSNYQINSKRRRLLCLDLVNALEYLHEHNIVHMDLKPANIIVTDTFSLKLSDFGCSIKLDTTIERNTNKTKIDGRWTVGTWFYRAPELFRNENNLVTTACDIYSLGICMWQLLTRDYPYNGNNPHCIIYKIVAFNLRPQYPDLSETNLNKTFEETYKAIVENCWDADPTVRYSAKNIKKLLFV